MKNIAPADEYLTPACRGFYPYIPGGRRLRPIKIGRKVLLRL